MALSVRDLTKDCGSAERHPYSASRKLQLAMTRLPAQVVGSTQVSSQTQVRKLDAVSGGRGGAPEGLLAAGRAASAGPLRRRPPQAGWALACLSTPAPDAPALSDAALRSPSGALLLMAGRLSGSSGPATAAGSSARVQVTF